MNPHMILERNEAEQVGCDYCHAQPFQTCFNPKTKIDIANYPAHLVRIRAARYPQGA